MAEETRNPKRKDAPIQKPNRNVTCISSCCLKPPNASVTDRCKSRRPSCALATCYVNIAPGWVGRGGGGEGGLERGRQERGGGKREGGGRRGERTGEEGGLNERRKLSSLIITGSVHHTPFKIYCINRNVRRIHQSTAQHTSRLPRAGIGVEGKDSAKADTLISIRSSLQRSSRN